MVKSFPSLVMQVIVRSVLQVITSTEVRLWFSRRLFLWVLTSWYYSLCSHRSNCSQHHLFSHTLSEQGVNMHVTVRERLFLLGSVTNPSSQLWILTFLIPFVLNREEQRILSHRLLFSSSSSVSSCASEVVSVQQDHGAAGPERDRPPPAAGGHPQPGLLLQGPHAGAEGQGAQGPVQLWPPGYVKSAGLKTCCVRILVWGLPDEIWTDLCSFLFAQMHLTTTS